MRLSASLVIAFGVVLASGGAGLVAWGRPLSSTHTPTILGHEQVPATPTDLGQNRAENSPQMMADPTNNRFVVLASRQDAPNFSCALQVSGDGGNSWAPAQPAPNLPTGAERCYAPEVAFDRAGTLYYLFVGLVGLGNTPMGVFLTTSTDRARTFTPPRQIMGPDNFGVRMAIDPDIGPRGRLHFVWIRAGEAPGLGGFAAAPNPIVSAWSDDGGAHLSDPIQVSDTNRQRVVAPVLALGPNHAVHVGYYDLGRDAVDYQGLEGPAWDETWSLVESTSTDGGNHFGQGIVVDNGIVPSLRVMLIFTMPPASLVATSDRTCTAWTDARFGDDDVLARCSSDSIHWTGPQRVNDDPVGNGRAQYLPRLALGPGGRVDVVFYDRRADLRNQMADVTAASSLDGRRFGPNVRITSFQSDTRLGAQYGVTSAKGLVEWGSRLGLLEESSGVVAAWADSRNARDGLSGQDVFTARLVVYSPASRPSWAAWAGLAFVVVGIAVVAVAVLRKRAQQLQLDG